MRYLIFIIISIVLSGCSVSLQNLTHVKKEVKQYYESGKYDSELMTLVNEIKSDFKDYKITDLDAVIFDVDETTLSNYKYINSIDFGYNKKLWNEYLMKAEAEPIAPILDLYKWFLSKGSRIIFLTGRQQSNYNATITNLINAGYTEFDTLICRSMKYSNVPAEKYKSDQRKLLAQRGFNIIATIGDLYSDLEGDYTGRKYKLPNYLYSF